MEQTKTSNGKCDNEILKIIEFARCVHDLHVKCKSRFKYALRFIMNNENMLRKEALVKNLADLNPKALIIGVRSRI